MTGFDIRFSRLFRGNENVVVVAVDHGEFFGPISGLINLPRVVESIKDADGILMSPGMIKHCIKTFTAKERPALIVRLNWSSSYAFQWNYNDACSAAIIPAKDALIKGADLGLASCILKTDNECTDTSNVSIFAEIIRNKRRCGLPVVGEYYPVHKESLSENELHSQVVAACRIMSEIGADAVKTFHTGRRFREIIVATPVPVLVLGAEKTNRESEALELAYTAVNDGARGVVFGRNVFQSRTPENFLNALSSVVKKGTNPQTAAKEYSLD